MIYSYFDFGLKPAVFGCVTIAIAPPPLALARELFKGSNGSASLNSKKNFGWGLRIFCE